jgi:hypothetical protein
MLATLFGVDSSLNNPTRHGATRAGADDDGSNAPLLDTSVTVRACVVS